MDNLSFFLYSENFHIDKFIKNLQRWSKFSFRSYEEQSKKENIDWIKTIWSFEI